MKSFLAKPLSTKKNKVVQGIFDHLYPGRVRRFFEGGIDFVPDKREGYRYWDIDGHELLDLHLNGGTFNLGHKNPQLVATVKNSLESWDIGNHHFPSAPKAELSAALIEATPGDMQYVVLTPSASEANDIAIKSARYATGRRKVIALDAGYHGRTGLSGAAGDDETAEFFNSHYPDEFGKVPFNDLDAMSDALSGGDVALVLIEPIPATSGFPLPDEGYLSGVKKLCEKHSTLFLADEVQTGLGRTGFRWAVSAYNIEPDMMVIGKGLSGGLYPMAALVMTEKVGSWLKENGWGHVSTFGGSDLGCCVALEALKQSLSDSTLENVQVQAKYIRQGLEKIKPRFPFFIEIRQLGLVMGLKFSDRTTGHMMMRALYENGIWAIVAGFDESVLQFKPGALIDREYCDEILTRFENACIWLVNNMNDLIMGNMESDNNPQIDFAKQIARQAVGCWDIGEVEITLIKHRENSVFRLTKKNGESFALRVHRADYHSDQELLSELNWMQALNVDGVSTPAIIKTSDGQLFVKVAHPNSTETRQCSLLAWVKGKSFDDLGRVEKGVQKELEARYYKLGLLAGKLHQQGNQWQPPQHFTRQSWNSEGLLGEQPLWGQFWLHPVLNKRQRSKLLKAKLVLQSLLKQMGQTEENYGLIHADFLPENILQENGQLKLIDFDDCGYGWYLFEMATSLFPIVDKPYFEQVTTAYVKGYRVEGKLSQSDLELLPAFMLIRALTYLGWLKSRKGSIKNADLIAQKIAEALDEFIPELFAQLTPLQRLGINVLHAKNQLLQLLT